MSARNIAIAFIVAPLLAPVAYSRALIGTAPFPGFMFAEAVVAYLAPPYWTKRTFKRTLSP